MTAILRTGNAKIIAGMPAPTKAQRIAVMPTPANTLQLASAAASNLRIIVAVAAALSSS